MGFAEHRAVIAKLKLCKSLLHHSKGDDQAQRFARFNTKLNAVLTQNRNLT